MQWGTLEEIDGYKKIILEMSERELRFALLMVLNGHHLAEALGKALTISERLEC